MTIAASRMAVFLSAVSMFAVLMIWNPSHASAAQTDPDLINLQRQVNALESRVDRVADRAAAAGTVVFVIACLCALWAQNTRRNAWLWFFLGLVFNFVTLIVLLWKNSDDLRSSRLHHRT